jgi:Putative beta-barrel porin 2
MILPNVNPSRATFRKHRWLLAFALAIFTSLPLPILAQDALVATAETVEPPSLIPPEESSHPSAQINAPLPVAGDTTATASTVADAGIPRRFHYELRLSLRGAYDDNINLSQNNRIADFYTTIEPSIMLGFGDTTARQENYLRLDYIASLFLFADHTEDNALQHLVRLETQYRINRLTLNLSQVAQVIDGTEISTANTTGNFDQRVNLDVAGRTRFNVYTTHLNAAYDLTGKTFLSAGADYSATDYSTLISSDVVSGNFFFNYNYSPKLVVGLGGIVGYDRVDPPTPDQTFEQVNARLSYQVTGKIDLIASGGLEFRDFKGQGANQYVSPVFEVGLNYLPFDGTRLSVIANRRTLNSAVLAGQDYAATTFSASVQQRLFSRFSLILSAGYENADYFSAVSGGTSSRRDNYYFVEPVLAVRMTRFWTVGAYYQHRANNSSLDAFSFIDNQVGLRTSLGF